MRSFASNRRGRLHADTRCRRGAQACIRDRLVPAVLAVQAPARTGSLSIQTLALCQPNILQTPI